MARMVEVTLPGVARNLVLSFMKPLLVKQQPIQPSHSYSLAVHLRYPESRIKPWAVHKKALRPLDSRYGPTGTGNAVSKFQKTHKPSSPLQD